MKRILLAILAILVLAAPCTLQAQAEPQGKVQMLLLPLTLELEDADDFAGLDSATFLRAVEEAVEKAHAQVDLVVPATDDPRLAALDRTQEPDPTTAVALAHKFGTPLVAWSKVEFRLQHQFTRTASSLVPQQPVRVGEAAPQSLLTVGGLARLGIVDAQSGQVLVHGPVAVFRSDLTRASQGTAGYRDAVRQVALQCAQDLAAQMVEVARKRSHQP